ncbi:MAG: hypothetical protein ACOCY7_02920 [Halodesulfurarchaeum sp.]
MPRVDRGGDMLPLVPSTTRQAIGESTWDESVGHTIAVGPEAVDGRGITFYGSETFVRIESATDSVGSERMPERGR